MCAYKLARYENMFAHTVAVRRLQQFIAYIYIFKTFSTTLFYFFLIIINALSFMWVEINGQQVRFAERKKKERAVLIFLIMKIYHLNFSNTSKISYCELKCTICSEKISYLFKFIRFSARRPVHPRHYKWVNWCNSAVLPWKK